MSGNNQRLVLVKLEMLEKINQDKAIEIYKELC